MATVHVNGVRLHVERSGEGAVPLVLVHGSWGSHRGWDTVVPGLAANFDVVTYDRRGHSDSDRPDAQGSVHEDVADLAGLIEYLGLAPAWVAGNSFGGSIALRLPVRHGELVQGVIAHEPPLFDLIAGDRHLAPDVHEDEASMAGILDRITSGDHAAAAQQFIETVLGPGGWSELPPSMREAAIENAPTFLDEAQDPDQQAFDPAWLHGFQRPLMLTYGSESPPQFPGVVSKLAEALPAARTKEFQGAGHVPHVTHPDAFVAATSEFILAHPR